MFGLNHWEILIILVLALILFGRKLPEVGKSLGKGIVEFKKGLKGVSDEVEQEVNRPSRAELPKAYRSPMAETGEDQRVSRADAVEAPATRPAEGH